MQKKQDIYPTVLEFQQDIETGITKSTVTQEVVDARNAIHLKIIIDRNDYPINDITNTLTELFQKVVQYFHE